MERFKPKHASVPEILPTLFIGKWTAKVIYAFKEKPHRHGELRRRLNNVSQRMLTKTLRNLESAARPEL